MWRDANVIHISAPIRHIIFFLRQAIHSIATTGLNAQRVRRSRVVEAYRPSRNMPCRRVHTRIQPSVYGRYITTHTLARPSPHNVTPPPRRRPIPPTPSTNIPSTAITSALRHRSSSSVPTPRRPTSSPIAKITPVSTHPIGGSWSLGPSAMECNLRADMGPCALDGARPIGHV